MKCSVLVFAALTLPAFADQRGDTPDSQPSTPQEQLAKFHVPPGFEVQLVAGEPEIQKPINLNFDAAGRLWVTGSELYPWPASTDANGEPIPDFEQGWRGIVDNFKVGDKAPQPSSVGKDSVRILGDFGPDGHARKTTLFADRLNIPSGIQPLPRKPNAKGDSAIVYSIPNIWLISDPDGDGFAQKREPLYTGFGYTDTHGGSSSYIYWIDGWIYGTHGFKNHSEVRDRNGKVTVLDSGNTYRFRPDGTAFEIYAHGQTNPFGLAFDPLGNLFSADSHSKPVYMLLRGGYYEGIGKQHDGLGFAPRITDDDHGSSSIAGIAYYADDKWPEEYRGNLFNGNPVTQRINRDRLEWHGSTPKAIRMPDFLTCDDPWFRPVNLKLGPDGALYIADFYNPIIGHYEVPLTHPARDHTHGRIWRVVYRGGREDATGATAPAPGSTPVPRVGEGVPPSRTSTDEPNSEAPSIPGTASEVRRGETPQPTRETRVLPGVTPDLTTLDAAGLVEKLANPSLEVRRLATNELVDRIGSNAIDPCDRALSGGWFFPEGDSSLFQGAHALWILERVATKPKEDIGFFASNGGLIGSAETRVISERPPQTKPASEFWRDALDHEENPQGVRVIADAMGRHPNGANLDLLLRAWSKAAVDDDQLIFAVRVALRDTLASNGTFSNAIHLSTVSSDFAEKLAGVSLAVKGEEAAAFLLTHLERTNLETPRAGEYLKHAALHLPVERFGEIIDLVATASEAPLPRRIALVEALGQAARQRGMPLPDEMIAWAQRAMIEAIASGDAGLARQGVDAVREVTLDAKLEPLTAIIRDEKRAEALRIAAMESLVNLPASRDLLAATLADPRHYKLRKRASELLVAGGTAEILAALPTAPFDLAQSMAGDLINHGDDACRELLDLIAAGKASPRLLRNRLIEIILGQRAKDLQTRAAALTRDLPPEDERLDKLIAQRAKDYAKAKPDAEHGAQVFQQNCIVCHRFHNEGGTVGPNLDAVIARGPARLIEDILDPNRNVDPAFLQTIIETQDGRILAGTNVRLARTRVEITNGGEKIHPSIDFVHLTDATGQELTVAQHEIKSKTLTKLSLMPPAFETQLTPDDFNDLLAYLLSAAK